jgi:glc operon protein GlcG
MTWTLATGLAALLPLAALAADVTHFDAPTVKAAFAQGRVLFDGRGTNYMVHASRRDTPGRAEVHARDTDVIYVLEGTATLVTGGTVRDPEPSAADEVRGAGIDGGDVRRLDAGDVVIVPAGTPHWFRDVPRPLLYYVVKVR